MRASRTPFGALRNASPALPGAIPRPPRGAGTAPARERRDRARAPRRRELDASAADVDPDGGRSEAEIASLVTEWRGLLAQRRSHHASPAPNWIAPAGGPGTATPSRLLGPQELLNALTLMQSELESQVPAAPVPHALPTTAARQVKQHLMDQVRRLGMTGSQPPQLGTDEDTIDLVGMLFEYALQDRNLPAPIQAMLGRLQIPYLKVALLDKDFVAHKSHPARRLLDNLAQACVGWSEESDKDQRLYGKAHDTTLGRRPRRGARRRARRGRRRPPAVRPSG